MNKSLKILLTILCLIFVCIFSFSAYKVYNIVSEYRAADKMYSSLSGQYVSNEKKKTEHKQELEPEGEKSPIEVDFDTLKAQCDEVVGWIYSAETPINYPMVKADDNFKYLHRFIDGSYNPSGTIFLDCRNMSDFSDKNTIIYGHNMIDGSMFASVRNYSDPEYYAEHPTMYINTPDQNYRVDVFSGYVTGADSDTYTTVFMDDTQFGYYIDRIRSQSNFENNVEVLPSDRIITLSTCTYEYENSRYVVHGKLTPID